MLRYEIRLGNDNLKKNELVWREKYVSPDLSFISGVTDTSYNLDKFKALSSRNSINNTDGTLFIDSVKNVTRQGYIVVYGKKYEVKSGATMDYSSDSSGKTIEYHCIQVNGKYFYWNKNGYTINNLVTYKGGEVSYDEVVVECKETANTISIDTVYWIEDGIVNIDGYDYVFDKNEDNGILKYGENGEALEHSAITECTSIEFHPYESTNKYQDVTKFTLTKADELPKEVSRISFVRYFFYVLYKNHYCGVKKVIDGNGYKFVCEIPTYVVNGGTKEYDLKPQEYPLYFMGKVGDDYWEGNLYELSLTDKNIINEENYGNGFHNVKELDELLNVEAFIHIDGAFFNVESDVMNANSGNRLGVYLEDEHAPLRIGDTLTFVGFNSEALVLPIYNSKDYNGKKEDINESATADTSGNEIQLNEEYALYNGSKYLIHKNLCDKVVINDKEYDIRYDNGKAKGKDCFVLIDGEEVPFKITSVDEGEYSKGELTRYGKIVVKAETTNKTEVVNGKYDIKPYDGIVIDGKNHIILEIEDEEETEVSDEEETEGTDKKKKKVIKYSSTELSQQIKFRIDDIKGSSLYICSPYLSTTDFTDNFIRKMGEELCSNVVAYQSSYRLMVKNKIFGEEPIEPSLAFKSTPHPISSDDYYNLFDDLIIYIDTAYIQVPIKFTNNKAVNGLLDNIIQRDFYEAEKKKAINPIVDMEKDVYLPKYIANDGEYEGSKTDFKPIYEINLNFHFRTRNLDNWKVNDGYNQVEYAADKNNASNDNWFITDFYPYREILKSSHRTPKWSRKPWGDILQESSDLMGLLYFTNDDIYYQRSKVGKSFVRLSFYDSTDPQTQSLLATSCVFVDEHKLFKKFIDNSRKNVYDYGRVMSPEYQEENGFISPSPSYSGSITQFGDASKIDKTQLGKQTKVSVMTEFIGPCNKNEYKEKGNAVNIEINEGHRISSRLTINNKHTTNTSSEGYYLYIFREYSENLHPKPIYMKVEFNHAGIGKTIPFTIPMYWKGNTDNRRDLNYNKMYPQFALKLSNNIVDEKRKKTHLDVLKEGTPLSYVYAQTYIPLYAVYDYKNKEYGYVFDNRYVTVEDGILNLNLFEMKIQNEENATVSDGELEDIKRNMQPRAIINVNTEQFDKRHFNYETQ